MLVCVWVGVCAGEGERNEEIEARHQQLMNLEEQYTNVHHNFFQLLCTFEIF